MLRATPQIFMLCMGIEITYENQIYLCSLCSEKTNWGNGKYGSSFAAPPQLHGLKND